MHRYLPLLLLCAVAPLRAQTVEFDVPAAYHLVEGRLSVTFADTVAEASARAHVAALGYEVVTARFADVILWAGALTAPDTTTLARLRAASAVKALGVHHREGPLRIDDAGDAGAFAAWPCFKPWCVRLTLLPATSTEQARRLLAGTGLSPARLDRKPHEIEVAVPPGEEEAAQARLEASPLVKYVSFIHQVDS